MSPESRDRERSQMLPNGVVEICSDLWRWTAAHPDWRPDAAPGSAADWDRFVGSVCCLVDGSLVFIDALVPAERADLWAWLERLAADSDRVHALTTIGFHRRSRDQLVDRLGARTSRARAALPSGVEKIELRRTGEVDFWLSRDRALVVGDRILGAGNGGLRLCPPSWLAYLGDGLTQDDLRERLRPLLDLPVEHVLVSHGEPVIGDGATALADLLRSSR